VVPKRGLRRHPDARQSGKKIRNDSSALDNRGLLIALWLMGIITSTTIGGFIHVLLVLAIIIVLVNVIRRGKV